MHTELVAVKEVAAILMQLEYLAFRWFLIIGCDLVLNEMLTLMTLY